MLLLQQRLDLEVVVDSAYLPCAVGLGRELRGGLVYFEDSVGIFIQPITVRTVIVLLLPDAEDIEIGTVALNQLERSLSSTFCGHSPVVGHEHRMSISKSDSFDAAFRLKSVDERSQFARAAIFIADGDLILSIVTHRSIDHRADLEEHRERRHKHHDRDDILNDNDDLAVKCLGLEPERSSDNLDRLGLLDDKRGNYAGDDPYQNREQDADKHAHRRDCLEDRDVIVQHLRSRRGNGLAKQDGDDHSGRADYGALDNHLHEYAAFRRPDEPSGGHLLGTEAGESRGHIHIVQDGEQKQQEAHSGKQHHCRLVAKTQTVIIVLIAVRQEIDIT